MPHTYRVQVQALDREVPPLQFDCQNHDDIFAILALSKGSWPCRSRNIRRLSSG